MYRISVGKHVVNVEMVAVDFIVNAERVIIEIMVNYE